MAGARVAPTQRTHPQSVLRCRHYWQTCLWCLVFGLDTWNVGGDILADRRHWYSLELFSRYGGARTAADAPGAFVGMHDGLDCSDAQRFPAAEFGAVRVPVSAPHVSRENELS